jgi:Spy/CpxP family protein refolding chaperone
MKRFITTFSVVGLGMVLLLAVAAQAQAPAAPGAPGQAQKLEALAKQLNLTPQQKMQLLPILEADAPKIQAIKNNTSLGPLQKIEQMKAVHAQSDPQIKSILNPQQYEQFQQIRQQEIQAAMQKRMGQQ